MDVTEATGLDLRHDLRQPSANGAENLEALLPKKPRTVRPARILAPTLDESADGVHGSPGDPRLRLFHFEMSRGSADHYGQGREVTLPVGIGAARPTHFRAAKQPEARASDAEGRAPRGIGRLSRAVVFTLQKQLDCEARDGLAALHHSHWKLISGTQPSRVFLRYDLRGQTERLGP